MKRLLLASLIIGALPCAARGQDLASSSQAPPSPSPLAVAVSAGSGGSPLGHVGLELRYAHRRFEAFVGAGFYLGDLCQSESHPPLDQCFHPVAALGARYAVLRVDGFELLPGLGLSFQRARYSEQATRAAAYGPTSWEWVWGSFSPRLNADVEARYRTGAWFYGVDIGAGVMIGEAQCTAQNMMNLWSCSNVPSPAYAAPTAFALTAYGQLVLGRGF